VASGSDGYTLRVEGLVKSFGGLRALDGVSFGVLPGTITGLIGPNGAGKTTLLDVVCGVLRPDRGRVYYQGRDITGLPPHTVARLGLGRTFQLSRVFPRLTVWENLRAVGRGPDWVRRAVQLLELTGLSALAGSYAAELSYGQQRLVELARVMMLEPRLVLLDEPGAGVNPTMRLRIFDVIGRLRAQGVTFLVVEHDMAVVMRYCDRVVGLDSGRVVAEGTPEEVRQSEALLAAYFGVV
jgi:ABC-type branched-subunit amino acid transport system ATPase component